VILVVAAVVFFVSRLRGGDFEHGERLSLLPLADDGAPVAAGPVAREARVEPEEDSPHVAR
jgi:hypothetical protein